MMNSRQRFQSRQNMLSSDYEVYHYFDRGMTSIDLHHHDFYEAYFLIEGRISSRIEGRNYEIKPGDIILVNSSELHQTIIHDLDRPYERIVLWLNPGFVAALSSERSDLTQCFEGPVHRNVIRTDVDRQQHFRSLLGRLMALKDFDKFGRDLYARAYLLEILLFLNEEVMLASQRPRIEIRKSQLIESVIAYIEKHLDEEIPIDSLAEAFYLSKFHLCREFRNQTGTTLHRYIIKKKLIRAKELILKNLPITAVYQQAGFGDYSNFFRAFRNEYGVTPRQFYDRSARGE